jgi:7-cyano-7-deazaguanine synthase in queuosine biosynthesis
MARHHAVILVGGGLRSLVATSAVVLEEPKPRVTLLYFRDGRSNTAARAAYVKKQAEYFEINRVVEVSLPRLEDGGASGQQGSDVAVVPLLRPQILLTGMAQALAFKADRLIWPVQSGADFTVVSKLTEQVTLAMHLMQLEAFTNTKLPVVETPLLDLSDQQLIELGVQMGVPWELGWTCLLRGQEPCRVCDACRRRQAGFDSAGLWDPQINQSQPAASR